MSSAAQKPTDKKLAARQTETVEALSGSGSAPLASRPPAWWRDALCLLALLALCLVFGLPRYKSGLDFGDEGLLSYGAVRVMDGQVPNRDFVTLQPPLSFYNAALAFKILGTSLVSLRLAGLGIYCLLPLLSYGIARRWTGPWISASAAVPSLVLGISFAHFVPVAVWQGELLCLAAALTFLASCSSARLRLLALPSGLLTASAVLTRQDQGFYLTISLLFFALLPNFIGRSSSPASDKKTTPQPSSLKSILGLWLLGAVALLLPLGIYWLSVGAIGPMYQQLVRFPLTTYSKTSSLPFPSFHPSAGLRPNATTLLYYLPPVVCFIGILAIVSRKFWRRFSPRHAGLLFLLVWSALFYCQVLVRTDMDHLLIVLPPFFILCACGWAAALRTLNSKLAAASQASRRFISLLSVGVPSALLLGFLILLKPDFLLTPLPPAETILLPRAGVRKEGAANLKKFIERIQAFAPPNQSILCLPYQPMFYFLAERRNPTRWNYLWPGDQTGADHRALIEQARKDPPSVVIITEEPDMQRYAPAILDYVHHDYQLVANAGGMFWVYVRK